MDETNTTSGWSARRKFLYTSSIVVFLTFVSFLIFWKFWYSAPSCFDSFKNGDETGIDCGGGCALVCSAEALPPIIRSDPRLFQVYPGVYSLLTFVENHNIDSSSFDVPYVFKIYDAQGNIITERRGVSNLIKNKTIAIFEGNVNIATSTPARVSFELSPNIVWSKTPERLPEVKLLHSPLLNEDTSPSIQASIENLSLEQIKNIEIVSVIMDGKDNAIAASRTFIDTLNKGDKSDIFFTWPNPFALESNICEKPSAVELLIDRSGSMAALGQNPSEPLTTVKMAAQSFVSQLRVGDKAGLISFATNASNPPDLSLTTDFEALNTAISHLTIATTGTQYTNIQEAIAVAREDLKNEDPGMKKVAILLTDGMPNRPAYPTSPTSEAKDIAYAEDAALKAASGARGEGINFFTIGLGKDVNQNFLEQIASSSDAYFAAPSASDLKGIYDKISSSICTEVPARIEMFVNF